MISRISQESYHNPLIVVVVFESHWLGGVLALVVVVVVRRVGPRRGQSLPPANSLSGRHHLSQNSDIFEVALSNLNQ